MPVRGRASDRSGRSWILGWRADGSASFYVDQDPVFQFNAAGEIRRAYVSGRKLSVDQGRLSELVRASSLAGRLSLKSRPLSPREVTQFCDTLGICLFDYEAALGNSQTEVESVGVQSKVFRDRALQWVRDRPTVPTFAAVPNAG